MVQDQLGLLERIASSKAPQQLKEAEIPRQVALADTTKHPHLVWTRSNGSRFSMRIYSWPGDSSPGQPATTGSNSDSARRRLIQLMMLRKRCLPQRFPGAWRYFQIGSTFETRNNPPPIPSERCAWFESAPTPDDRSHARLARGLVHGPFAGEALCCWALRREKDGVY
jgi:hypothetical protein